MNLIKATNTSSFDVKFTMRVENTKIISVMLKPNEFAIGMTPVTAQLDTQRRRGFIVVEENLEEDYSDLELGKPYISGFINEVQKNTKEYTGE